VFTGLDDLPEGLLLWRSMLQWFGGIGIIVVAMVFLPELRVGGMQIFRSEAFDTMGKILPRATEIAARISVIYLARARRIRRLGLHDPREPALRALHPVGRRHRAAALPRQPGAGLSRHNRVLTVVLTLYRMVVNDDLRSTAIREGVFNVTSIISGTGYAERRLPALGVRSDRGVLLHRADRGLRGVDLLLDQGLPLPVLFASISTQIRSAPFAPRRLRTALRRPPGAEEVLSSVMAFFVLFFVSLGVVAVLLGLTGLDTSPRSRARRRRSQYRAGAGRHDRAVGQFLDPERHRQVDPVRGDAARPAGADRRAGPVHRRLLAGLSARQSAKLRLTLIWSQAQTTSCRRSSSERSPPFMSG
jgi:trk system potassium uptake protein TrkH